MRISSVRKVAAALAAGIVVAGGLMAAPASAEDQPPNPDPTANWCSANLFFPDGGPKLPPGTVINGVGPQGKGLYQCIPGIGWIKILDIPLEAPPIVAPDADPVTVGEGATATNSGAVTWAGVDPVVLTSDVGVIDDNGDGTWDWSLGVGDGPATTTVTITATAGPRVGVGTFDVNVTNVAPTVTSVTPNVTSAVVGQPVSFTGVATDPSSDDTTAGFAWSFDGGAGTSNPYQRSFATCGVHTVSATAEDTDDAASAPAVSSPVAVTAVALQSPLKGAGPHAVKARQNVPVKADIGCGGVALAGANPSVEIVGHGPAGVMKRTGKSWHGGVRIPTVPAGTLLTLRVRPNAGGAAAFDAVLVVR